MENHAKGYRLPEPGTPQYNLVLLTQTLLKREIAAALYTQSADSRIAGVLAEIGKALRKDAREVLSPVFPRDNLQPSERILGMVAGLLADGEVVTPPEKEGGKKPQRKDPDITRDGGRRDGGSPRYHLTVYLDKVVAHRLTSGPTDDEFRVTGGYTYHGSQVGLDGVARDKPMSMTAWEHSFAENGDEASEMAQHLPHMLFSEPVPPGDANLMMTLTPTEEDLVSAEAARAMGKLASLLMTMGVDLLAGMAVAAGHALAPGASALTAEAQQLIRDYATPGLVGLIQQALGPELFRMPLMRVDTNWTPGTPVHWRSWGWYADKPTNPPSRDGAGENKAEDIRVDEIKIEVDAHNVLHETVVNGGGTYTLDIRFLMTEIT